MLIISFYLITIAKTTSATIATITAAAKPNTNYRDWETVIQTLGLRTQPMMIKGPVVTESNLADGWEFGETYQGRHKIWIWTFGIEHDDVFNAYDDPLGGLIKDFEQVPVITGLDETVRFLLPIFYPHGAIKNIYFKNLAIDLNNI